MFDTATTHPWPSSSLAFYKDRILLTICPWTTKCEEAKQQNVCDLVTYVSCAGHATREAWSVKDVYLYNETYYQGAIVEAIVHSFGSNEPQVCLAVLRVR